MARASKVANDSAMRPVSVATYATGQFMANINAPAVREATPDAAPSTIIAATAKGPFNP